jgi:hypothetical protein
MTLRLHIIGVSMGFNKVYYVSTVDFSYESNWVAADDLSWNQMRPFNSRFFSAGGGTWEKKALWGGSQEGLIFHSSTAKDAAFGLYSIRSSAGWRSGCPVAAGDWGTGIMWQAGNDQVAYPGYNMIWYVSGPPVRPIKWDEVWIGGAVKTGIGLVLRGWEKADGFVFNAADPTKIGAFEMEGQRSIGSVGGGGSMELVIITGVKRLQELQGTTSEGWDFAASLGEKWTSIIKAIGNSKVRAIAGFAKTVFDAKGKLKSKDWEQDAALVKLVVGAMAQTVSTDYGPSISLYDIPGAGGGLELSLCYTKSKVTMAG